MRNETRRNILINMKSPALSILIVLSIACTLIVQAHRECTCGGLGQGTNPCSCSDVVVKAAKLPKPTHYVPAQKIKEAIISKAKADASSGTSQCGCSNSQSSSVTNNNRHSNSSPYSDTASHDNSNANQSPYTNEDSNTQSENGIVYLDKNPADVSYSDNDKQNMESLDTDDETSVDGNVAPRFPPVGDLCYPLPHSNNIVEKTSKVTPARPGKLVCCKPSVPYEVCINTFTGEAKTRTLASGSFDATSSLYSGPHSAISNLPPLAYAHLNFANAQKLYSQEGMGSRSPDCYDDATGDMQDQSYPAVPADAVSLTLAYKNLRAPNVIYRKGKQFVPEDKLSFGHRTMPIDDIKKNLVQNIAEEKLVTVNKPVVELKLAPPKSVVIGSYDENEEAKLAELEAMERESIKQEESSGHMGDSLITYKDLGYAPIKVTHPTSRTYHAIVKGDVINDSAEEPCGPLGPAKPDYVPGKLIVRQHTYEDTIGNIQYGPKPCPT